jgi:hypothetical protein
MSLIIVQETGKSKIYASSIQCLVRAVLCFQDGALLLGLHMADRERSRGTNAA